MYKQVSSPCPSCCRCPSSLSSPSWLQYSSSSSFYSSCCCSSISSPVVAYAPEFVVHPRSSVPVWHINVTLECAARGFPEPVIVWLRNNRSLVNATVLGDQGRSLLVLPAVVASKDDGHYSCVARNDLGVAMSNEAIIRVHEIRKCFYCRI